MHNNFLRGIGHKLAAIAALLICGSVNADQWISIDEASGQGVYVWDSGMRYEGGVVQGRLEGRGVQTWTDSSRFEGQPVAKRPRMTAEGAIPDCR